VLGDVHCRERSGSGTDSLMFVELVMNRLVGALGWGRTWIVRGERNGYMVLRVEVHFGSQRLGRGVGLGVDRRVLW